MNKKNDLSHVQKCYQKYTNYIFHIYKYIYIHEQDLAINSL